LQWHPGGKKINNKIPEIQPNFSQHWKVDTRTDIQTDTQYIEGTAVAQWLRYCATNQKVAGSIPDGITDINTSDRTMALGSTQPLTEMSTRSISWG
jgi:hypothetical protein